MKLREKKAVMVATVISLIFFVAVVYLSFQSINLKKDNDRLEEQINETFSDVLDCSAYDFAQVKVRPSKHLNSVFESPRLNAWLIRQLSHQRAGGLTLLSKGTVKRIKEDQFALDMTKRTFREIAQKDSSAWVIRSKWYVVKILEEPQDLKYYNTAPVRSACYQLIRKLSGEDPGWDQLRSILSDCLEMGISKDNLRIVLVGEKGKDPEKFDEVWGHVLEEFNIKL